MAVEKITRLQAKLEDLRRERQRLQTEMRERMRQIEEIDRVIRGYLNARAESLEHEKRELAKAGGRKKK